MNPRWARFLAVPGAISRRLPAFILRVIAVKTGDRVRARAFQSA